MTEEAQDTPNCSSQRASLSIRRGISSSAMKGIIVSVESTPAAESSTYVGNGSRVFSGDGGPATQAGGGFAWIAIDSLDRLYVTDVGRVRRVDSVTGAITTIAGNGKGAFSGDGGPASLAGFFANGIAIASDGSLLIADRVNGRIRRVATDGIITTIAGNGAEGSSGDGGPATEASFRQPLQVAVDTSDNVYVTDSNNNRVRRIGASTGIIDTIAGSGPAGPGDCESHFSGDGGPASEAELCFPDALVVDSTGMLFFSANNRIRRVDLQTATIDTYAGNGTESYVGDGGPATLAVIKYPGGVALDGHGTLFVDQANRLRAIDLDTGTIRTIAGDGVSCCPREGFPATETGVSPNDVAIDSEGNIYIAQAPGVYRIERGTRVITRVAGSSSGVDADGIPATQAKLGGIYAIAFDRADNLYLVETIFKAPDYPGRLRKVDRLTGLISTIAGNGTGEFSGDGGPATLAGMTPEDLAVDFEGNIFIADAINARVRRIDAGSGMISTVAGSGVHAGPLGDGGPATQATMEPFTIAVDASGNLLIGAGARIRRVSAATQLIETVSGTGEYGFSGDLGPSSRARIGVVRVEVDQGGNTFFSHFGLSGRIRVVYQCTEIGKPQLTSPAEHSSGVTSSPRLAWQELPGAFRYDVYLDSVAPPAVRVAQGGTVTSFSPSNLEPLTTYYWKVVAKGDPFCDPFRTAESDVWSFTTASSCDVPGTFEGSGLQGLHH